MPPDVEERKSQPGFMLSQVCAVPGPQMQGISTPRKRTYPWGPRLGAPPFSERTRSPRTWGQLPGVSCFCQANPPRSE